MKELFKALADFQQECPVIKKEVKGYGYKYSDLPAILEVVNPLLKKHGLGFTQFMMYEEDIRKLVTELFHVETAQNILSVCDLPIHSLKGMNDYQSLGSAITYIRRYELSAILGIVTEEDTDAAGEQTSKKELPWMTEKIKQAAITKINETTKEKSTIDYMMEDGVQEELTPDEFLAKLAETYRMKRVFKEEIKQAIQFQEVLLKTPKADPEQLEI